MKSRRKMLVVADDYGISEKVDLAILEKIKNQKIDVVSILPNMVSIASAKKLKNKKVKIAAHLNIVEGRPVSDFSTVPCLVNKSGYFYNLPSMILKLFFNRLSFNELEIELDNQIKKLAKMGLKIGYLNSHQHILSLPRFAKLKKKLLVNHGIDSYRSPASILHYFRNRPISLIMIKVAWMVDLLLIREKLPKTNGSEFEEIIHPGTNYDKRWF